MWSIIYRLSWLDKKQKDQNNSYQKKNKKMLSICINSRVKSWKIKTNSELIMKIEPFINKDKVHGMSFPIEKKWLKNIWEQQYNNCS